MRMLVAVALLAACTKAPPADSSNRDRDPGVIAPQPVPQKTMVTLMSVTFGDDCGGSAPTAAPANAPVQAPKPVPPTAVRPPSTREPAQDVSQYRDGCAQTSMQLSIASPSDATVAIKSVEVFDDKGASLGVLAASKPTRWSDANAAYATWDEKVAADKTALVSYVLSQPGFVNPYQGHDRMYTVKVIASVGGADQGLQTTVMVAARPPPVPT
jgi:hypothetical protein